MITRQDIEAVLHTYWEENGGADDPVDHSAVRALLDKADLENGRTDPITLVGVVSMLDDVVAAIHGALCDPGRKACIEPDRLDAAGRAVLGVFARSTLQGIERNRPFRPEPTWDPTALSTALSGPGTGRWSTAGALARVVRPLIDQALAQTTADVEELRRRVATLESQP
jgi:hypothetical protein